jgi:hypothetical protein
MKTIPESVVVEGHIYCLANFWTLREDAVEQANKFLTKEHVLGAKFMAGWTGRGHRREHRWVWGVYVCWKPTKG